MIHYNVFRANHSVFCCSWLFRPSNFGITPLILYPKKSLLGQSNATPKQAQSCWVPWPDRSGTAILAGSIGNVQDSWQLTWTLPEGYSNRKLVFQTLPGRVQLLVSRSVLLVVVVTTKRFTTNIKWGEPACSHQEIHHQGQLGGTRSGNQEIHQHQLGRTRSGNPKKRKQLDFRPRPSACCLVGRPCPACALGQCWCCHAADIRVVVSSVVLKQTKHRFLRV